MDYVVDTCRVTVNMPDWATLSTEVERRLSAREGFALATLNLDHLVKLAASETFREAYAAQDLVTADGNPIVWMSRMAGRPVDLLPGSDMIVPLARIAARLGIKVALVGSTETTLAGAAAHLERQVPGLQIASCIAPPMGFDPCGDDARRVVDEVRQSGAGLCLVALGAPKQEQFAAAGRRHAPDLGFVSIGAGLDFFAGAQERAPAWMRGLAIEWIWRMASNPRRLGPRYAKCIAILPQQALRAIAQRWRSAPA